MPMASVSETQLPAVQTRPRVLVVDSSRIMQLLLARQLSARGYEAVASQHIGEALEQLGEQNISLVLLELELPDMSGLDLLFWLRQHRPYLPVILMAASLSDELRDFCLHQEVLYFEKSRHLDTLMTIIELKTRKKGLDIAAQDLMLFDLAQLCALSGQQRCLRITEPVSGSEGDIWFADNRIIHACSGALEGEDALLEIMRLAKGTFQEVAFEAPTTETIELPFEALMMGIATLIDEQPLEVSDSAELTSASVQTRALLIVDPDRLQRQMLEQHFMTRGYRVESLSEAADALQKLQQQPFDLLIAEYQLPDMTAQTFLEKLQTLHQGKVILLGNRLAGQTAQLARQWGAARCYQKPVILGELEAFVRYLFSQRYFSGKLRNLGLVDFLQVVTFGKGNKTYRIYDLALNLKGELYLRDGALVHAELGKLVGEAAFQAMLRIQRGLLAEMPATELSTRSIEIPLTRLLMRAFSLQDQSLAESGAGTQSGTLCVDPSQVDRWLAAHPLTSQLIVYTRPAEFAGIRIGRTSLEEARVLLEKLGSSRLDSEGGLYCPELDLTLTFDGQERVEEMHFDRRFRGRTHAGIRIGDEQQRAVFVYGKPRFQDKDFCVWDQVSFFCERGKITRISLGAI